MPGFANAAFSQGSEQHTQICAAFYGIYDLHMASDNISERFDTRLLYICTTQISIKAMHWICDMDKQLSIQKAPTRRTRGFKDEIK